MEVLSLFRVLLWFDGMKADLLLSWLKKPEGKLSVRGYKLRGSIKQKYKLLSPKAKSL